MRNLDWQGFESKLLAIPAIVWLCLTFVVNGLMVVMAVVLLFAPKSAQMSAYAITEVVSVIIPKGGQLPAGFAHLDWSSKLPENCSETNSVLFPRSTTSDIRIDIVSRGVDTVDVTFRSEHPVGRYRCDEKFQDLGSTFVVSAINNSQRFVMKGQVKLGDLPRNSIGQSSKLLLSGYVLASSSSFPFRSGRVEQRSDLLLGDEVRFFESLGDRAESVSDVIVKLSEAQRAFEVVVHTKAKTANVGQLGRHESYPISNAPSIWSRVESQGEWTMVVGIMALLLNVLGAIRHYSTIGSISQSLNE